MNEFNRSSPNVVAFAMASLFLVSAILVSKGYYKGMSLDTASPDISSLTSKSKTSSYMERRRKMGFEESFLNGTAHKDEKLQKLEADLAAARALIREATKRVLNKKSFLEDADYVPRGEIYSNAYAFHWSYLLMERMFKIYMYEEGEPPIFHNGPCKSIYSMEGMFLSFMESDTKFRTWDPDEAHVYFLPFSVVMIVKHLFDPIIRDKAVLQRTVVDYVHTVSHKYPYWNRSLGADHFMLSCHDWGPRATWYVPHLYYNSIRVLCNANTSEHFNPQKDASFPEINLKTGDISALTGGSPLSRRTTLAFFAGHRNGRIRPVLFHHWKNEDADVKVYENLPRGVSYERMMRTSKFCLCPSGHEVASPRVAEAIFAECVPVLISQQYVPPFRDVLNWDAFSVSVSVEEIPRLKQILAAISDDQYARLRRNVKLVQKHFVLNYPPKRYDVFHMIVHSVWLRRLNARING